MNIFRIVMAALVALTCSSVSATVVTVNALTRDTAKTTISDSLNNRLWLGWDITKGLTYAQTIAATGVGGKFSGYSVAYQADALLFNAALLGATDTCSIVAETVCSTGSMLAGDLVGESYTPSQALSETDWDLEVALYLLSPSPSATDSVGHIEISTVKDGSYASNFYWKTGLSLTLADQLASNDQGEEIGWLLYKTDSNAVPEPSGLALAGAALGMLIWQRRKLLRSIRATE